MWWPPNRECMLIAIIRDNWKTWCGNSQPVTPEGQHSQPSPLKPTGIYNCFKILYRTCLKMVLLDISQPSYLLLASCNKMPFLCHHLASWRLAFISWQADCVLCVVTLFPGERRVCGVHSCGCSGALLSFTRDWPTAGLLSKLGESRIWNFLNVAFLLSCGKQPAYLSWIQYLCFFPLDSFINWIV